MRRLIWENHEEEKKETATPKISQTFLAPTNFSNLVKTMFFDLF
jgi:hypothetical protein